MTSPWTNLWLVALILFTAVGAIFLRDLISAVFVLGAYSFFLAILWAWLGAVDVAFTEAVVGAGLSTIFFLLAFFYTSTRLDRTPADRAAYVRTAVLVTLGVLLATIALDLPIVGDPTAPAHRHISPIYIERSLADTNTPNVVMSVLVDYRGLDSLIETAVIFTAAMACRLLLREDR